MFCLCFGLCLLLSGKVRVARKQRFRLFPRGKALLLAKALHTGSAVLHPVPRNTQLRPHALKMTCLLLLFAENVFTPTSRFVSLGEVLGTYPTLLLSSPNFQCSPAPRKVLLVVH